MKRGQMRRARPRTGGAQPQQPLARSAWKRCWLPPVLVGIILCIAACGWAFLRDTPVGGLGRVNVARELTVAARLPAGPGALAGANLLLITMDTTRADYLGCYGSSVSTPALDSLAHRGVLFSQAITTAPITLPAHASLLTGFYPHHHGARSNAFYRLDEQRETLARTLKSAGYATGAVISAFVLESRFGLSQGFDYYNDDFGDAAPHPERLDPQRRGDLTTNHALEWLHEHAGQPFFLWVHYYDPHAPFDPPAQYAQQYPQSPYAGEIAFMDAQIGRLLEAVDQLGRTDDTLVVAVADHGEGLSEHGEAAHGYLLYNATVHVPLIMACGRKLGGGVHVPGLVSITDVMPTALSLLGVAAPPSDGCDLTRSEPSGPVYCESLYALVEQGWAALFAVFNNQKKYVFGPNPLLFDLAADPQEARNLTRSKPEVASRMLGRLSGFFGPELTLPGAPEPTQKLDPVDLAKLQALGYAGQRAPDDFAHEPRPDPAELLPLLYSVQKVVWGVLDGKTRPEQAIRAVEDVIRTNPGFYPAYQHLADLLSDVGDLNQAATVARRGLELRPRNVSLLSSLAHIEMRSNDGQAAAELFRRVLAEYPESFDAQIGLGVALLASGQPGEATDLFLKVAHVAPEEPNACRGLAQAAIATQRTDEAARLLAGEVEAHPALVPPRMALAAIRRRQKLCAQAADLLREGLLLQPNRLELADELATTLLETDSQVRDPREAARIMEAACQRTDYKKPEFMLTLSTAYYELGRRAEAIRLAQQAQQLAWSANQTDLAQRIAGVVRRYQQSGI
jgi:arylsulfatase A-like enzyme/Flp pilus assembly protein TadD